MVLKKVNTKALIYWAYKFGNIKEINIKNQTYYFFDDMINIKDFDPNVPK